MGTLLGVHPIVPWFMWPKLGFAIYKGAFSLPNIFQNKPAPGTGTNIWPSMMVISLEGPFRFHPSKVPKVLVYERVPLIYCTAISYLISFWPLKIIAAGVPEKNNVLYIMYILTLLSWKEVWMGNFQVTNDIAGFWMDQWSIMNVFDHVWSYHAISSRWQATSLTYMRVSATDTVDEALPSIWPRTSHVWASKWMDLQSGTHLGLSWCYQRLPPGQLASAESAGTARSFGSLQGLCRWCPRCQSCWLAACFLFLCPPQHQSSFGPTSPDKDQIWWTSIDSFSHVILLMWCWMLKSRVETLFYR